MDETCLQLDMFRLIDMLSRRCFVLTNFNLTLYINCASRFINQNNNIMTCVHAKFSVMESVPGLQGPHCRTLHAASRCIYCMHDNELSKHWCYGYFLVDDEQTLPPPLRFLKRSELN